MPARNKGAVTRKSDKGLFRPGYAPEVLWTLPVSKRKIDLSGHWSPEDTIIAVARGMHPGVLKKAEDKAIIAGGLAVLKAAKKPLPKKRDVESVRNAVSRHGKGLKRAAWGARGLILLGGAGMRVSSAVHAAVPAVAVAFGPIGLIVSAAAGAHMAISGAVAKKVAAELEGYVKQGLAPYKRMHAKRAAQAETVETVEAAPEPAEGPSPWWILVGVAALGGVVVWKKRRKA